MGNYRKWLVGMVLVILLSIVSVSAVSAATIYYTTANLTVRAGAGTNYKAVGWLSKGAKVSSLAKTGKWHHIIFKGKKAYVSGNYLTTRVVKPAVPPKPVAKVLLNVPLIAQRPQLPTGCEIVAVTMMLKYKGANVEKTRLAREMPKHASNPNLGYVGNPFNRSGYTIYPPALMKLTKKYAGSAVNMTGAANVTLEKKLKSGRPVVAWTRMHGFSVHAVTLTGYDGSYYYYNDPWTVKKNVRISKASFNSTWNALKKRAISY
ncbi:C39 family peptidase [Paenilisteria newyorkensis]|nr:hypothetical protein EP58_10245 [Listeria newyorkensis]SQC51371.1 Uncharacterized protein conserved in bacteria [Listeria newyorkensis]